MRGKDDDLMETRVGDCEEALRLRWSRWGEPFSGRCLLLE